MQSNDAIVDETKDDHRKREQRRAYLIREAVSEDVVEDIFYVDGDDDVNVNDMELRTADISTTNRTISMYCRRICRQMIVLRILFGTIAILIILTFVEPPHWCRNFTLPVVLVESQQSQQMVEQMDCSTIFLSMGIPVLSLNDNNSSSNIVDTDEQQQQQQQQYYPNTGTSIYLTISQSHCIELFCITIVSIIVLLRIGRDGMDLSHYLLQKRPQQQQRQKQLLISTTTAAGTTTIRYNRFVQIICLLFSFMSILLEHITQNQQYTQYNPYIRLILLYTFLTSSSHRDVQILIGVVPVCFYLFSDYLSLFLGAGSSLSTRVLND
jgi:hypothetical protein